MRDYVSRDLFAEILRDEEEHVDFLETQFEMIARMGLAELHPAASEAGRRIDLFPACAGARFRSFWLDTRRGAGMASGAGGRIATLDIVRGVAVMGILAMNIVAFAPSRRPTSIRWRRPPMQDGDLFACRDFVLFDGKMRGLFTFLFGASLLLMSAKQAIGRSDVACSGCCYSAASHFFLIWLGDILITYAAIGFLALAFRNARPRALIVAAVLV